VRTGAGGGWGDTDGDTDPDTDTDGDPDGDGFSRAEDEGREPRAELLEKAVGSDHEDEGRKTLLE